VPEVLLRNAALRERRERRLGRTVRAGHLCLRDMDHYGDGCGGVPHWATVAIKWGHLLAQGPFRLHLPLAIETELATT